MDRFYRNNAEGAERIRAMILSGDVSDDDSIDDGVECDRDYVEGRESVSVCAQKATTYDLMPRRSGRY